MKTKLTFSEWMYKVDAAMLKIAYVSSDFIADYCYRDEYDRGCAPAAVAKRALKADGF